MKKRICLSCNRELVKIGTEYLRTGKVPLLGREISSPGFYVDLYQCPDCGRLEFYRPVSSYASSGTPQRTCPKCGTRHDSDCSQCPVCGYNY